MDLSKGYDEYRNERRAAGTKLLSQAERKARKLAREVGPVRLEWHTSCEQAIEHLVAWKRQQLRQHDYLDVFAQSWLVRLIQKICTIDEPEFSGVLSTLYAGDQPTAIHLGLRGETVFTSWIPTLDYRFAKYSPGLILHVELAKAAAQKNLQRIDLGRGSSALMDSLATGAIPLAIGAVDCRPVRRAMTATWHRLRDFVHASPLRGAPLQAYRRVRNWAAQNASGA